MDDRIDVLSRRLEVVERQNRSLRRWGGAALVVGMAVSLIGQGATEEVPKVLKTRALQVVDDQGTVRISLGVNSGAQGAFIMVGTENKETRFALATGSPLGSVLTMYGRGDGSESPGIVLHAKPGKSPPLFALHAPESSAKAEILFEDQDKPQFVLHDKNGKVLFQARK